MTIDKRQEAGKTMFRFIRERLLGQDDGLRSDGQAGGVSQEGAEQVVEDNQLAGSVPEDALGPDGRLGDAPPDMPAADIGAPAGMGDTEEDAPFDADGPVAEKTMVIRSRSSSQTVAADDASDVGGVSGDIPSETFIIGQNAPGITGIGDVDEMSAGDETLPVDEARSADDGEPSDAGFPSGETGPSPESQEGDGLAEDAGEGEDVSPGEPAPDEAGESDGADAAEGASAGQEVVAHDMHSLTPELEEALDAELAASDAPVVAGGGEAGLEPDMDDEALLSTIEEEAQVERKGTSYIDPYTVWSTRPNRPKPGADSYYHGSEYSLRGRQRAHVGDDYRQPGGYGSESVDQYKRDSYVRTNAGAQLQQRRSKRFRIAAAAIAVVVVGLVSFLVYRLTMPVTLTVNNTEREVPHGTTYAGLHDLGYLTEGYGDYVAVDGSILEVGKGRPYHVYVDGVEAGDVNDKVRKDTHVTEAKGDNIVEEHTTTETPVPWTWNVAGSHYNGALGMMILSGSDGVDRMATGTVSGITAGDPSSVAMVPRVCRWYNVSPPEDRKVIALTFDGGPSAEYTEQILKVLSENDAKATFFAFGQNVEQHPEVAKAVVDQGSQIASHGYDNAYLISLREADLVSNLQRSQEAIRNATGVTTTTLRAPGGLFSASTWALCQDLVTCEVYWNADSNDWAQPGVDSIVANLLNGAQSGRIMLLHDGGYDCSQTIEALRQALPELKEQGYSFVTIDELQEIERENLIQAGTITEDGKPGENMVLGG
ncbi:MAG: polysaccharide deacetylase family protein [Coriobacteriales bacterium]|nr:polysaccharide deacetylase family protein [Coriobacteriales bacterium]